MGGRYKISAERNRESSVCACVCVREGERERESSRRERKGGKQKAKSKGMSERGETGGEAWERRNNSLAERACRELASILFFFSFLFFKKKQGTEAMAEGEDKPRCW